MNKVGRSQLRKLILMLLFPVYTFFIHAEYVSEIQVFSDGDYGLAFDWQQPFLGGHEFVNISDIVADDRGNSYVCGYYRDSITFPNKTKFYSPDNHIGGFVSKFNEKGDMLWAFELFSNKETRIHNLYLTPQGDLLAFATFKSQEIGDTSYVRFDHKQPLYIIYETKRIRTDALFKINTKTGYYKDVITVNTDAKTQPDICLSASGDIYLYSFIDTSFVAMDTLSLRTSTRSHGGLDAYIAKINPEFTLAWDYAVGGSRNDVPWMATSKYNYSFVYDNNGENTFVIVGDTMILKMAVFSDSVDIDLNPAKETFVDMDIYRKPTFAEGNQYGFSNGALLIKYLLTDSFPVLLDYKADYTFSLPYQIFAGQNGQLYATKYENPKTFSYRHFDSSFRVWEGEDYPFRINMTFWPKNHINKSQYVYDKNGDFLVGIYERLQETETIDLSETTSAIFEPDNNFVVGLAKYDSNLRFRWAWMALDFAAADQYYTDGNGGVFIGGYNNFDYYDDITDFDPDSDLLQDIMTTHTNAVLLKYTETFRIKAAETQNGHVVLPQGLVRYGDYVFIDVIPDAGYKVESVTTSRGETLNAIDDGSYPIPEVTDVVTVFATFTEK